MATTTTKLSLRKPDTTDTVNVETDLNDNYDIIDTEMGTEVRTSFPASPYTGKLVMRSDLQNRIYSYNGTGWVLLNNGPYAILKGTSTSIPNNTQTIVPFATEIVDTDGGHDTVTNNGRYTFPIKGLYLITSRIAWSASTTNAIIETDLVINNTDTYMSNRFETTSNIVYGQVATKIYDAAVNDYVETHVFHNTGSARSLSTSNNSPMMEIAFLRAT